MNADQPGGVRHWQHTRALARAGHDVTVVTSYVQHKERTIPERYRGKRMVHEAEDGADPLETLDVADDSNFAPAPARQAERAQVLALIEKALEELPVRQRQAFLLRYWEELDVAAAAKIMGCSQGSVKTHCSRAVRALAIMLRKQGIEP